MAFGLPPRPDASVAALLSALDDDTADLFDRAVLIPGRLCRSCTARLRACLPRWSPRCATRARWPRRGAPSCGNRCFNRAALAATIIRIRRPRARPGPPPPTRSPRVNVIERPRVDLQRPLLSLASHLSNTALSRSARLSRVARRSSVACQMACVPLHQSSVSFTALPSQSTQSPGWGAGA